MCIQKYFIGVVMNGPNWCKSEELGGENTPASLKIMRWNQSIDQPGFSAIIALWVVHLESFVSCWSSRICCFQSTNQGEKDVFARSFILCSCLLAWSVLNAHAEWITRPGLARYFRWEFIEGAFKNGDVKTCDSFCIGRPIHWLKKCGQCAFEAPSSFFVFRAKGFKSEFFLRLTVW